ncbi:MAG: putative dynein heavy chain [Streblomastix strix]|uniref:Putative dynein heavy chain n=1 Tax=Streblomastix strix TaxID=222440 RepID=A0A5J4V7D2_9EUKA|nr:MAG: putative dynein heavy chain [Streblomastix strix]
MSYVMDDNRLLTLRNKERIVLRKECAMLFEVSNLKYAQPTTLSRCGMVYVDPYDIPPRTIFIRQGFVYIFDGTIDGVPVQLPEEEPEVEKPKKEEVNQYTAIAFGEDGKLLQAIPQTAVSVEVQLCNIYQALVPTEGIDYSKFEEPIRHMLFIFAAYWACGGSMFEGSRVLFDEFYKHVVDLSVITAIDHDAGPNQLPGQLRTLFDFYFDVDKKC